MLAREVAGLVQRKTQNENELNVDMLDLLYFYHISTTVTLEAAGRLREQALEGHTDLGMNLVSKSY